MESLELHDCIVAFLAAQEPATLPEIMQEVNAQLGISNQNILAYTIAALASLMTAGTICEYEQYEQMPLDDPMDYAWVLSHE
jgi:hypothetical protein